jgi:transcriptional regulator of acetoin/glycerol metabolism
VLTLPPLRSRPEDVPRAVERLLRARRDARQVAFTPALLERLRRQPWPTNLTGLAEVVTQLLACRQGPVVDVSALDEVFQATVRRRLTPVEWLLRTAIVDALRVHGGNKELAAASLGMSRASIYRKIKSLDIDVSSPVRD